MLELESSSIVYLFIPTQYTNQISECNFVIICVKKFYLYEKVVCTGELLIQSSFFVVTPPFVFRFKTKVWFVFRHHHQ